MQPPARPITPRGRSAVTACAHPRRSGRPQGTRRLSVEALVCKLGGSRLSRWPAGEPSGHGDRHRPVHDGFVVPGQAFVVADGAAAPGDPGQGSLDDPAAGRTWKVCRLSGRLTIWSVNLGLSVVLAQVTSLPT